MLTTLVTMFLQALGFALTIALIWGVPTYFIYREQYVPEEERWLWIVANAFLPWIAFLAFMLVAPVTRQRTE